MKHKNRYVKAGLLIGLCFLFLSSSAFFVTQIQTENVISFGNIKVELINHTIDENGDEIQANTEEDLLKNKNISRIVKVKNICKHPAYIRIKLVMDGSAGESNFQVDDYYDYVLNNDNCWQEKEGWIYYTKALQAGETSENLMEGIRFDVNKLTSDYPGSRISWTVKVQAVQSENNADDVFQVNGWPEDVIVNE